MPFKSGTEWNGNPGGRPKNLLQIYLRSKDRLPHEIYNAVHPLLKSKIGKERIFAAEFLRDSAWGKPVQMLEPGNELSELIVRMVRYGNVPEVVSNGNGNGNGNGNHDPV